MGLSRTVSEINGDFSRKSQIFPISGVFDVPAEGVPFDLGTGAYGQKIRILDRERSLTIYSAVWIH